MTPDNAPPFPTLPIADTPAASAGRTASDLSAIEALALLDAGGLDAESYWEELGRRAEDTARFNVLSTPFRPHRESSGSLDGLPFLVKDSIDVAGLPTTAGTPALDNHRPAQHAPVVQRLLDAGAAVAGKTVMHELSFGATSRNALHGYPRNPWDESRICGGSSGGAAGAVALGLVPFALGSDTGGSIRVPAALCGVVGFRPTVGRYPAGGCMPLSWTRDTVGPIARTVEDIIAVDAVLSTVPPDVSEAPPRIRLGLSPSHQADLDADVKTGFAEALQSLDEAGVEVVPFDIDDIIARTSLISDALVMGEFEEAIHRYLEGTGLDVEDVLHQIGSNDVASLVRKGRGSVQKHEYAKALIERRGLQEQLASRMADADVHALIYPTAPVVAPLIGEEDLLTLNGRKVPTFGTLMRHSQMGGTLGLPGLSLPAGIGAHSGLPLGVEITAPNSQDDDLLALGLALAPMLPRLHPTAAAKG